MCVVGLICRLCRCVYEEVEFRVDVDCFYACAVRVLSLMNDV